MKWFQLFGPPFHAYQQLEHSDCGQTCIRMICRHYGLNLSRKYLRDSIIAGRHGMSIAEIRHTLRTLGFMTAAVRIPLDKVKEAPLPAIAYWNSNHYVVVYRINSKKGLYYIADPGDGKRTVPEETFRQSFYQNDPKGIMILCDPQPEFPTISDSEAYRSERYSFLNMLRQWVSKFKKSYGLIILLMAICLIADIISPFLFQHTVDEGIGKKDIGLIWTLILSQIMIFAGSFFTSSLLRIKLTKVGLKMGIKLVEDYLTKLVRMPMAFFARKVNSDFIQKISDHDRLANFFLHLPQTLLFTIINIIIFGGLLCYFSPFVFFIFLGFTVLAICWLAIYLRHRRELDYSLATKSSENRNNLFELVRGVEEIKANNAQQEKVRNWKVLQERINSLSYKAELINMYQNGGHTLLYQLRDISITGLCATLVAQDVMTLGVMMTVSYLTGRLSVPFNSMLSSINNIQDASISYSRVEEIQHSDLPTSNDIVLSDIKDIELNSVSFRYPGFNTPWVLKNISQQIPVGKTTAIVGESGSGKSTLLKLLLGFYNVTEGGIYLNGIESHRFSADEILARCAMVMQSGTIFTGSILSNIALSDQVPDILKAERAPRLAMIDSRIQSLPMGYNTRIGKNGLELSGGEKQRIFIARALYRNPEIFILDEATSSLDAVTEAQVIENIKCAFRGKTLIIAAHRLSTVQDADEILVMKGGSIIETGNHKTLIENKGYYRQLVERQLQMGTKTGIDIKA